jgi:hypothetical protein
MAESAHWSRRHFLSATAAVAGSSLLPAVMKAAFLQDPVVNTVQKDGKPTTREKVS